MRCQSKAVLRLTIGAPLEQISTHVSTPEHRRLALPIGASDALVAYVARAARVVGGRQLRLFGGGLRGQRVAAAVDALKIKGTI